MKVIILETKDGSNNKVKTTRGSKEPSWTPKKENSPEWLREKSFLYNKKITCPVCGSTFEAKAVRSSSYRILSKDTDLFIRYSVINPYFYDVWLCNNCGYATMKVDFLKLRKYHVDSIKERITPSFKPREYPDIYNIDIAIERFKLSLLNYVVMEAKASSKGVNCLKLAWMYRLKKNKDKELLFLKQALENFKEAYSAEDFPIYGMNKHTIMYLIAELLRRTGNEEKALMWLSQVITSRGVNVRLKNLARDQRDLIKEKQDKEALEAKKNRLELISLKEAEEAKTKKKSIFSKFFKK